MLVTFSEQKNKEISIYFSKSKSSKFKNLRIQRSVLKEKERKNKKKIFFLVWENFIFKRKKIDKVSAKRLI